MKAATYLCIQSPPPDENLSAFTRALVELGEPMDELGFLTRVGFAAQIAYKLMLRIDKVPVQPRNSVALRQAKSGEEFMRLAKTARMLEEFAREWESTVQASIPVECGLRFYIVRETIAGRITIGFRFGQWDTADFKGASCAP